MKKNKEIKDPKHDLLINIKNLLIEIQKNDSRLTAEQNQLLHQYYNEYFNTNENNGMCSSCVNRLYTILLNLVYEKGI